MQDNYHNQTLVITSRKIPVCFTYKYNSTSPYVSEHMVFHVNGFPIITSLMSPDLTTTVWNGPHWVAPLPSPAPWDELTSRSWTPPDWSHLTRAVSQTQLVEADVFVTYSRTWKHRGDGQNDGWAGDRCT